LVDPTWSDIGTVIAIFVAAEIGVVTFIFYPKQHQLNGLVESFKLLNSVDHRNAIEQVYTLFKIYQEKKDLGAITAIVS
jgi:hypothetical protein